MRRWQRGVGGWTEVEHAVKKERKKERKLAWLGVIANADGYEAKADGVSDWLLSPALHDRYKTNTELSPHFRWHRVIETLSAPRVNLGVIQAVPNHLDPFGRASPFLLDKPITPVNKFSPAIVITQWTGGTLQRRRICALALSHRSRGGGQSLRAPSFHTGGISADRSGNKSSLGPRLSLRREISRAKWHLTICWMEASLYVLWYERAIHSDLSAFHVKDGVHEMF